MEVDDARVYEGMDARNVLPPLLRDGMLMDWDAVRRWEELAIETLSSHRNDVDRALAIIEDASEEVCETWTPANGTLVESLASAFADADASGALKRRSGDRSLAPPHSADAEEASAFAEARARYAASHLFACWPMYEGRGIRGALHWLLKVRTALDEERRSCPDPKEAFRRVDLALRHRV